MQTQTFIDELSRRLRDVAKKQWDQDYLLSATNAAIFALCRTLPEVYTVNRDLTLVAGTEQNIDADLHKIVTLLHNVKADGSQGRAITQTDMSVLDAAYPQWRQDAPREYIRHWMNDEFSESRFYVWPPAEAKVDLVVDTTIDPVVDTTIDPVVDTTVDPVDTGTPTTSVEIPDKPVDPGAVGSAPDGFDTVFLNAQYIEADQGIIGYFAPLTTQDQLNQYNGTTGDSNYAFQDGDIFDLIIPNYTPPDGGNVGIRNEVQVVKSGGNVIYSLDDDNGILTFDDLRVQPGQVVRVQVDDPDFNILATYAFDEIVTQADVDAYYAALAEYNAAVAASASGELIVVERPDDYPVEPIDPGPVGVTPGTFADGNAAGGRETTRDYDSSALSTSLSPFTVDTAYQQGVEYDVVLHKKPSGGNGFTPSTTGDIGIFRVGTTQPVGGQQFNNISYHDLVATGGVDYNESPFNSSSNKNEFLVGAGISQHELVEGTAIRFILYDNTGSTGVSKLVDVAQPLVVTQEQVDAYQVELAQYQSDIAQYDSKLQAYIDYQIALDEQECASDATSSNSVSEVASLVFPTIPDEPVDPGAVGDNISNLSDAGVFYSALVEGRGSIFVEGDEPEAITGTKTFDLLITQAVIDFIASTTGLVFAAGIYGIGASPATGNINSTFLYFDGGRLTGNDGLFKAGDYLRIRYNGSSDWSLHGINLANFGTTQEDVDQYQIDLAAYNKAVADTQAIINATGVYPPPEPFTLDDPGEFVADIPAATWDANSAGSAGGTTFQLSDGDTVFTHLSGTNYANVGVTESAIHDSGKYYFEFENPTDNNFCLYGFYTDVEAGSPLNIPYMGNTSTSYGYQTTNGRNYNNNSYSIVGGAIAAGTRIFNRVDFDTGVWEFSTDGSTWTQLASDIPPNAIVGVSVATGADAQIFTDELSFEGTIPDGYEPLSVSVAGVAQADIDAYESALASYNQLLEIYNLQVSAYKAALSAASTEAKLQGQLDSVLNALDSSDTDTTVSPGHVIRGTFTKTPRIDTTVAPVVPDEPEPVDGVAQVDTLGRLVVVDEPIAIKEPAVVALGDGLDHAAQGLSEAEFDDSDDEYDEFLLRNTQDAIDALNTAKGRATTGTSYAITNGDIFDINIPEYARSELRKSVRISFIMLAPNSVTGNTPVALRNASNAQAVFTDDGILAPGNVLRAQYVDDTSYGLYWRVIGVNIRDDGAAQDDVDNYNAALVVYNEYLANLAAYNAYVYQVELAAYNDAVAALDAYNAVTDRITVNDELPLDDIHVPALQEFAMYYAYSIDDDMTANSGRAQRHWLAFFQIVNKAEDATLMINQSRGITE